MNDETLPAAPATGTAAVPQTLQGQTALITGAAGGLGSALVHALARRGATVIAADVDPGGLRRLSAEHGRRIHPLLLDLTDPDGIVRAVAAITDTFGGVDILIHTAIRHFAAGDGNALRAFTDHTPAEVMETLAVAVTGPTLLTQLLCAGMVERRAGRIVFTGSMLRAGSAGLAMYTAGKAYVNALARALFAELRQYRVKTLVVHPGGMHTGLHRFRHPWMLEPGTVAEAIAAQITMPANLTVLSFEIVPHDPEHPDALA